MSVAEQARQCTTDSRAQCAHLRVLYINDFHGNLEPPTATTGGAAYLAAYVNELKGEARHTLFLGGGDLIGASPPISGLLLEEPTLAVLGEMGMDASAVGNHEFDAGYPELLRLIDGGKNEVTGRQWPGMKFPFLGANVYEEATDEVAFPPYEIYRIQGVPVAVVGLGYTNTPGIVVSGATDGLYFVDEAVAANQHVEDLKIRGKKAFIVVAHLGGTGWVDDLDDEVDLVLGGHSHSRTNTWRNDKLVVQAGSAGTTLGVIDIILDKRTRDVRDMSAELVTVRHEGMTPDKKIDRMVAGYAEQVAPIVNRVVGEAASTITRTRNAAGESALGNLIADAQRTKMGTDFAFMNAGGIRANIQAGPVTWGDLYTVQPFGNNLVTMTMSGEQVKRLLEQQWQGGSAMLQIGGLEYQWSASAPTGSRVVDIWQSDGTPVDPAGTYTVTVNIFLAGGGDGYGVLTEPADQVIGPNDLDALVEYIEALPQPFDYTIEGRIDRLP
jgi:5'-nucleotidase